MRIRAARAAGWSAVIRGWRLGLGWLVCILLTIVALLAMSVTALLPLFFTD